MPNRCNRTTPDVIKVMLLLILKLFYTRFGEPLSRRFISTIISILN